MRKIIGSEKFRVTCLIRARPVVWMDILESSLQAVVNAVSELKPAGTRTCLIATLGGDLLAWHPLSNPHEFATRDERKGHYDDGGGGSQSVNT